MSNGSSNRTSFKTSARDIHPSLPPPLPPPGVLDRRFNYDNSDLDLDLFYTTLAPRHAGDGHGHWGWGLVGGVVVVLWELQIPGWVGVIAHLTWVKSQKNGNWSREQPRDLHHQREMCQRQSDNVMYVWAIIGTVERWMDCFNVRVRDARARRRTSGESGTSCATCTPPPRIKWKVNVKVRRCANVHGRCALEYYCGDVCLFALD